MAANSPTPYQDVNIVISSLVQGIQQIFQENLIGIYLFGSLSYGDFNPKTSDIDLVSILQQAANREELELIKKLHQEVAKNNPQWTKRVEASYTPITLFSSILPPQEPRPYYGEDTFYEEAPYGNEWIINNYLLYRDGIALVGPEFTSLVPPIDIEDVQKANIKDLLVEWEPKLSEPEWLNNSHYQAYLVLNLCRILHTILVGEPRSKKVSAIWVKKQFPQWQELIEAAEKWEYGAKMNQNSQVIGFLKFTLETVKESPIYASSSQSQ